MEPWGVHPDPTGLWVFEAKPAGWPAAYMEVRLRKEAEGSVVEQVERDCALPVRARLRPEMPAQQVCHRQDGLSLSLPSLAGRAQPSCEWEGNDVFGLSEEKRVSGLAKAV